MPIYVAAEDLSTAIRSVVDNLVGIDELYPSQRELIQALVDNENVFYTGSTNSGKTLPTVMFPNVLKKLNSMGYSFPVAPKILFITALNSLQLSLVHNTKALGIKCEVLTSKNAPALLTSEVSVIFVSPEVLKLPLVTKQLLAQRKAFVLKVVDEAHLGKEKMGSI